MRRGQTCWWSLFVFLASCNPMLAQVLAAESGYDGAAFVRVAEPDTIALFGPESNAQSATPPQGPEKSVPESYGWHIAVYPALAWAPVFGASISLPPTPTNPIESPSGNTNSSLNGAYFGGLRYEPGKWSADAMFMWAALSAERETPFAHVGLDFIFGDAMVGREVVSGLYVEGGFRRLAFNIDATVGDNTVKRSPGYWDPLIGSTYRRALGKKWRIFVHGDGGGFGVGSDVDVTAAARAEWQFVRHFGVTMGYGGMHFSDSDTKGGATLKISQTLHGPIFGLGVYF